MKDEKFLVRFLKLLLFCLIVSLGVSSYAKAAPLSQDPTILYVKSGGKSVNCTSWDDACDLQVALTEANIGDQIRVAVGTYIPTTLSDRFATFQLKSGVAIYGGFPAYGGGWETRNWVANRTTLSGDIGPLSDSTDNSYHVVTGIGVTATAVLDGFTISGGNANGSFPNNKGGGMFNAGGNPTLTNIIFTENSANMFGGGIFNDNGSSPTLTNVTFSENTATDLYGGGMYNSYSNPTLTNVTFSGNTASRDGGGMYNTVSSPKLTNVTFSHNTASYGYGGGMYNDYSSSPTLTNVTFSNNTTHYDGGGMYNGSSSPSLTNVTFSHNTTSNGYGGGMYNDYSSSPIVTNAIFWGNTPAVQIYNDGTGSATITYSDIQGGYTGTGNINAEPNLGGLANNGGFTQTHAIGVGSPAIDTANPAFCPTYDQRYFVRPIDGDTVLGAVCDMGAFEYGSSVDGFTLTVETEGSGSVIKKPVKLGYRYGEEVTLTATANPGWSFDSWSGATVTDNKLTITGNTTVTANFTQNEYTLTVLVNPEESGTVTRDLNQATYTYGTPVTLTATANSDWTFSGWSGATVTDNKLTIAGNTTVTANFTQDEYTLTVATIGSGSVIVDPEQTTYHYGDLVTLTATANSDWTFSGWSGDATGTANPLNMNIQGNINITANFTIINKLYLPLFLRN